MTFVLQAHGISEITEIFELMLPQITGCIYLIVFLELITEIDFLQNMMILSRVRYLMMKPVWLTEHTKLF